MDDVRKLRSPDRVGWRTCDLTDCDSVTKTTSAQARQNPSSEQGRWAQSPMLAEELLVCDCAGGGEGEPVFLSGVTPDALTTLKAGLRLSCGQFTQSGLKGTGEHTEYEVG